LPAILLAELIRPGQIQITDSGEFHIESLPGIMMKLTKISATDSGNSCLIHA
jgi:hypothetical protein